MDATPRLSPCRLRTAARLSAAIFGRSAAVKALDHALREAGLHSVLVPEPVKLTVVRLHKRQGVAGAPEGAYGDAAQLLAYCVLGRDPFVESNGVAAADRAEQRAEAAIAARDSLDAKIILLALHAGVISAEFADRIDVEDS